MDESKQNTAHVASTIAETKPTTESKLKNELKISDLVDDDGLLKNIVVLYARGMTTYSDHTCKSLPCGSGRYCRSMGYFISAEHAVKWLHKNGAAYSNVYNNEFDDHCVFCIYRQEDEVDMTSHSDDIDLDILDYNIPTYVMSEGALKMVRNEHYMFCTNDWASPVIANTYYLHDGIQELAANPEHFAKCLELIMPEYRQEYVDEWAALTGPVEI